LAGENLRKYVRVDKEMQVRVIERHLSPAETRQIETVTRNLGEGGVFVEIEKPPAKGTIVEVEFVLGEEQKPIRTLGIVRWTSTSGDMVGAGIKFAPVNEADRANLLNLVKKLKKKPRVPRKKKA